MTKPPTPPPNQGIHPGRAVAGEKWSSSSTMRQVRTSARTGVHQKQMTRVERFKAQRHEGVRKTLRLHLLLFLCGRQQRSGQAVWALPLGYCVISTCGLIWVQSSGCCWHLLRIASSGCECGSLSPESLLRPRMSVSSGPVGSLRWRRAGYGNGL